jgi:hypothetical protein
MNTRAIRPLLGSFGWPENAGSLKRREALIGGVFSEPPDLGELALMRGVPTG